MQKIDKDKIPNNLDESKYKELSKAYNHLTLGISIIVAIALGTGLGYLLYRVTGLRFLLICGVVLGIAAGILNVYKAYKSLQKDLEELKDNPKYQYQKEED